MDSTENMHSQDLAQMFGMERNRPIGPISSA
jgi:hypothetical protein